MEKRKERIMKKFGIILETLSGIMVLLTIVTFVIFAIIIIWSDNTLLYVKLIGTDIILFGFFYIMNLVGSKFADE